MSCARYVDSVTQQPLLSHYKPDAVGKEIEGGEGRRGGGEGGEEPGISFNGKISSFHRLSTLKKNQ